MSRTLAYVIGTHLREGMARGGDSVCCVSASGSGSGVFDSPFPEADAVSPHLE